MPGAFCKSGQELAEDWFKLTAAVILSAKGAPVGFINRRKAIVEKELLQRFQGSSFLVANLGSVHIPAAGCPYFCARINP